MKLKNENNGNVILQFSKTEVINHSAADFAPTTGAFAGGFGCYVTEEGNLKYKAMDDSDWRIIAVPAYHYPNIVVKAISKDSTCTVQMVGV